METLEKKLYYKGYISGYRDGVEDALRGKHRNDIGTEIIALPIKVMDISTRARNCLSQAGCKSIADVVSLQDNTIAAMRSLGAKSAREIANWLDTHGIVYTAWNQYL